MATSDMDQPAPPPPPKENASEDARPSLGTTRATFSSPVSIADRYVRPRHPPVSNIADPTLRGGKDQEIQSTD